MTDLTRYRIYDPDEIDPATRYPFEWQTIKHEVRAEAGHRCIRCGHPYTPGCGEMEEIPTSEVWLRETEPLALLGSRLLGSLAAEAPADETPTITINWSPCDEHCTHGGPIRVRLSTDGSVSPASQLEGWLAGELAKEYEGIAEVQAAWRILTVHHANERKEDLRWWNLLPLCQRDHLYIQRKVRMERPWPWEHSDWFRPHAAGWYAARYLGENLTREEATSRVDELLDLGKREEGIERMAL